MNLEQLRLYQKCLPEEVLNGSRFCVCEVGSKVPFNPITQKACRPNVEEDFVSFEEILPHLLNPNYDVIGIKVGTGGVCAIDIDSCVEGSDITPLALNIIEHFRSYTELSPSGTGIRILFHSKAKHDYEKYYTKNSMIGVETYPLNNRGRMVRLTGLDLPRYPYRKVTEAEYVEFCETHMKRIRPKRRESANIIWDEGATVTPERLEELLAEVRSHQLLRSLWSGNYYSEQSGSELDFALIMHIVRHVTNRYSEVKAVFESGRWYRLRTENKRCRPGNSRSRGAEFTYKWNHNDNQYLKDILEKA